MGGLRIASLFAACAPPDRSPAASVARSASCLRMVGTASLRRRALMVVVIATCVAATDLALATPRCRFPFEQRESTPIAQIASPHAALLVAPAVAPLRITTVDERVPAEVTCDPSRPYCELTSHNLGDRFYVFREATGAVVAVARGPVAVWTHPASSSVTAATRERLVLGGEAPITRRTETADPDDSVLFAVTAGRALERGRTYVWDVPSPQAARIVEVTKEDPLAPPSLPPMSVEPLKGNGACPPYGAYSVTPASGSPDLAYRWTILDASGRSLGLPTYIGRRAQIHAVGDGGPVKLGSSYVLEVEAMDEIGRASAPTRFPVTVTKTGGSNQLLGLLFTIVLVVAIFGGPYIAAAAIAVGAIWLVVRLWRKRTSSIGR